MVDDQIQMERMEQSGEQREVQGGDLVQWSAAKL